MRTVDEIVRLAQHPQFSKAQARALVDENVRQMVEILHYSQAEARSFQLRSIGYYTGYLDHASADRIMELFDTEHPIFGREHPTPEEALKKGIAFGEQMKARKDNQ